MSTLSIPSDSAQQDAATRTNAPLRVRTARAREETSDPSGVQDAISESLQIRSRPAPKTLDGPQPESPLPGIAGEPSDQALITQSKALSAKALGKGGLVDQAS